MHDPIEIDDDDDALSVQGAVITQAPVIAAEEDLDALFGEDEALEDLELPAAEDPRVAELQDKVDKLAAHAVEREQGRVRRKVTAATGGAGAVGFIPVLLQITGAMHVDPEVASTVV